MAKKMRKGQRVWMWETASILNLRCATGRMEFGRAVLVMNRVARIYYPGETQRESAEWLRQTAQQARLDAIHARIEELEGMQGPR